MHPYEWMALRVVPHVERCEFVNAGVVVYCQHLDYLGAAVDLDERRALALDPGLDVAAVRRHLEAIAGICDGTADSPVTAKPLGERFRWLASPRSTVLQPSPVHTGLTADPAGELARLLALMVHPPASPAGAG